MSNKQFAEFWAAYPRKVGKAAAERAYDKVTEHFTPMEILDGLDRWVASHSDTDPQFIPHPATWLNGRRWEDEEPAPVLTPMQRELAVGGSMGPAAVLPSLTPNPRFVPMELWPKVCAGWECECNPDRDKPKPAGWSS